MNQKARLVFMAGIFVILATTLMLLTIPIWTNKWRMVDFPCEWFNAFGDPPGMTEVTPKSRIAYCISVYPRDAYGAAPLVYGATEEDKITLSVYGFREMQRQGNTLLLNNQVLNVGETKSEHIVWLTFNPWLLATTDLTISNDGPQKKTNNPNQSSTDVIFISGAAKEAWTLTPLGLVYYGIGLGLIILAGIQRKRNADPAVTA